MKIETLNSLSPLGIVRAYTPTGPDDDYWYQPVAIGGGSMPVTALTALQISAVFGCHRILSGDIARTPLLTYRRTKDGREEAPNHYLHRLFTRQANPYMSARRFRALMQNWVLSQGNAYAYIEISDRGQVAGLWPWNPTRVTVKPAPDWDGYIYDYRLSNGQKITQPWTNILHLRGLELDGVMGLNPVQSCRRTFDLALSQDEYSVSFYKNGARPGGILSGPFPAGDKEKIRKEWNDTFGGVGNTNKTAVFQTGTDWKAIPAVSQSDAEFIATRKMGIADFSRIYGVPLHKLAELDKATFCLPGDAQVYTEEGPRDIAAIRPGDVVWSYAPDGSFKKAAVKQAVCSGFDRIITFRTTNRTVRMNANHRVRARVKARKLAPAGTIGNQWRAEWESEWVRAGDLRAGDTLVCLNGLPEDGSTVLPNGREASVGFLEFCGLLLSDGNLSKVHGEPVGVQIARASNALYMDHYRAVMREEFHSYENAGGPRDIERRKKSITLQEQNRQTRFMSAAAGRELDLLGLGGTARTKRIPGWVFSLTAELRLGLLRGYLDGDGSVDKKGRISFNSCNSEMLGQLRHLCMGLGIPVTNLRNQRGMSRLPSGKIIEFSSYAFTCSDPLNNRRIGSRDPRYVKRMDEGKPFGKKGRSYPWYGGRGFDEPQCELSRIASIEVSAVAEPVYDLQVEGLESFVADGVVVHNSNIEEQGLDYESSSAGDWMSNWESELMFSCLSEREADTIFVEFDRDEMRRGRFFEQMQAYGIGANSGIMTRDEARSKMHLNRRGGNADKLMAQVQNVPIDELPQQQIIKAPAASLGDFANPNTRPDVIAKRIAAKQ
jgi:HK97 family phage portal protein